MSRTTCRRPWLRRSRAVVEAVLDLAAGRLGRRCPSACVRCGPRRSARLGVERLEEMILPTGAPAFAIGAAAGAAPEVRVLDDTGAVVRTFLAYDPHFRGGVRTAVADLNGDGVQDIVTAPGPGGGPHVKVFDGKTGTLLHEWMAYDPHFTGGLFVAAGSIGNGEVGVATGADAGGGPHVALFTADGARRRSFMAYNPAFRGGVRVALGGFDAAGDAEVVTAAGPGGGPHVKVFEARSGKPLASFFAYAPTFTGGVSVAVGDVSRDMVGDILTGAGAGGGPHVRLFDGATGRALYDFMADDPGNRQGVQVSLGREARMEPAAPLGDAAFMAVTTRGQTLHVATYRAAMPAAGGRAPAVNAFDLPAGGGAVMLDSLLSGSGSGPRDLIDWDGCPHVDCLNGDNGADMLRLQPDRGPQYALFSGASIRYGDGVVKMGVWDAQTDDQANAFGLYRSWTNWGSYATGFYQGEGWTTGIPSLLHLGTEEESPYYAVVSTGTRIRFFEDLGEDVGVIEMHPLGDGLVHDTDAKQFIVFDQLGDVVRFWDFDASLPPAQQGQFVSRTDPAGNVEAVTALNTDGTYAEIQRQTSAGGVTVTESVAYTYNSTPAITSAVLRRKVGSGSWTTVRQVQYDYYGSSESHGNLGDLKRVTVKDASGNAIDTSYYRYYKPGETGGYVHALKYALGPASYDRLAAAVTDPETATDSQVAGYADDYYEYDDLQRVTKAVVQGAGCSTCTGGFGTYTFSHSYVTGNTDYYNAAFYQTVETLPDGNTNSVVTNGDDQPLDYTFTDTANGTTGFWQTRYEYNSNGQLTTKILPSDLEQTYQYYSGTGEAWDDLLEQTALRRDAGSTPVPQLAVTYTSHTVGGLKVTRHATDTVYRNDDGTGAETTSYDYTWTTGSNQESAVTVTLPTVGSSQNGPGTADVSDTVYDAYGRPTWQKDPDGFIRYTEYDPATGAVTKTITDVDTTQTSTFTGLPSGWSTPTGGGLHLTTAYDVDALGRTTKATAPNGTVRYTVYKDAAHEVRSYAWDATANQPIGPVSLTREDRGREYAETLTFTAPTTYTWGTAPDGTETIDTVRSLTRSILNNAGQTVATDQYFDLTGTSYSQTAATLGSQWDPANPTAGNYYRTQYAYDDLGRLKKTVTPAGTITRRVYDAPGRLWQVWVGTDDVPTSGYWSPTNTAGTDLVKVSENEYDGGGVGDSNLTKATQYPTGTTDPRVTAYAYDWRDRPVATKSGVQVSESASLNRPVSYAEYDNLNEVVSSEQYDGDGVTITTDSNGDGVPDRPSSGLLRAKTTGEYDDQRRVFRIHVFSVDPSSGSVSTSSLTTDIWADHRGQVVKTAQPGGLDTKTAYDGAGRVTTIYMTDGGGDSGWSDALTVTGDTVLEQVETGYDASGNVILTTTRQRFHDATGTGALGTPTSGVHARVSYVANYYDKADRLTDTVNVGTNGGSAWSRPSSVPSRSDTVLVNSIVYDDAGRAYRVTDPRGLENRTSYDLMGRTTKTIENYVNGTVSDTDDKTTEFTYFGPSQTRTVTADLTGGGSETTQYVYGVNPSDGSTITSNDLLRETRYPDKSTGAVSSSEHELSSYDAVGEKTAFQDRNGNVHSYSFDVAGRPTADAVTTLGSGVDGSVRRIETAYDSAGRAYLFTSYDAASGGSVVNQVQRAFNGLGQITTEYQATTGAVDTATTPKVQYTYSEMAGGANHSRVTSLVYPDGFTVSYNYASGLDNTISRLTSMTNGATTLEGYAYLGLGTVVEREHPQSGVNLTYIGTGTGDAGDQYVGLDRFGRVTDQRWTNGSSDLDRYGYGYDRDGNRTYKENEVSTGLSEVYTYDGLNQLASFERGTLSATKDGISGTVARSQSWDVDAVGNFESVTTDGTAQSRTQNKQNELTGIGSNTLTYDANGNLTTDETGRTFGYDAWNRTVKVNGTTRYAYDALGRRVAEGSRALYYTPAWQVIEERISGGAVARYVWSPVYVDALVLRDRDADGNGGNGLEERLYALQDANYNVTGLVSAAGVVLERYVEDPYGTLTKLSDSWGTYSGTDRGWVYLHQGGRWDATSGLFAFRRRDYNPTLMRWAELDPLRLRAGDPDLYRYEDDSPTDRVDPSGLENFYICSRQTAEGGGCKQQCARACGCPHTDIYGDESGEVYHGSLGPVPPTNSGLPKGPGWECTLLRPSEFRQDPRSGYIDYIFERTFKWGPKAGKSCKNATSADIKACLQAKPKFKGDPGVVTNCQTDVYDAADGCCLSSHFVPQSIIYLPAPP